MRLLVISLWSSNAEEEASAGNGRADLKTAVPGPFMPGQAVQPGKAFQSVRIPMMS